MEKEDDGMALIRGRRGLRSLLSRELPLSRSAINEWDRVPAEKLLEVERITRIPRELLRPELYDFAGRDVDLP